MSQDKPNFSAKIHTILQHPKYGTPANVAGESTFMAAYTFFACPLIVICNNLQTAKVVQSLKTSSAPAPQPSYLRHITVAGSPRPLLKGMWPYSIYNTGVAGLFGPPLLLLNKYLLEEEHIKQHLPTRLPMSVSVSLASLMMAGLEYGIFCKQEAAGLHDITNPFTKPLQHTFEKLGKDPFKTITGSELPTITKTPYSPDGFVQQRTALQKLHSHLGREAFSAATEQTTLEAINAANPPPFGRTEITKKIGGASVARTFKVYVGYHGAVAYNNYHGIEGQQAALNATIFGGAAGGASIFAESHMISRFVQKQPENFWERMSRLKQEKMPVFSVKGLVRFANATAPGGAMRCTKVAAINGAFYYGGVKWLEKIDTMQSTHGGSKGRT